MGLPVGVAVERHILRSVGCAAAPPCCRVCFAGVAVTDGSYRGGAAVVVAQRPSFGRGRRCAQRDDRGAVRILSGARAAGRALDRYAPDGRARRVAGDHPAGLSGASGDGAVVARRGVGRAGVRLLRSRAGVPAGDWVERRVCNPAGTLWGFPGFRTGGLGSSLPARVLLAQPHHAGGHPPVDVVGGNPRRSGAGAGGQPALAAVAPRGRRGDLLVGGWPGHRRACGGLAGAGPVAAPAGSCGRNTLLCALRGGDGGRAGARVRLRAAAVPRDGLTGTASSAAVLSRLTKGSPAASGERRPVGHGGAGHRRAGDSRRHLCGAGAPAGAENG